MKKAAVVLLAAVAILALVAVAAFATPGSSVAAAPAVQTGTPPAAAGDTLETCSICHKDAGAKHQASYDELYQDQVLTVSDVKYSFKANPDTTTVTFKHDQEWAAVRSDAG